MRRFRIPIIVIALLAITVTSSFAGATFSRAHVWGYKETLLYTDLNNEFNNILNNLNPAGIDSESTTLSAMQATTNPYPGEVESLATSLQEEIRRIRYILQRLGGGTHWYSPNNAVAGMGTIVEYAFSTPPAGWLFLDGGTIGDATSGATARANTDVQPLYEALWADYDNTKLIIQDSSGVNTTRGASAGADFAAHKRLPLPDHRGRVAIGTGQGLTAEGGAAGTNNALGTKGGAEKHTQTVAEMAYHYHLASSADAGHTHGFTEGGNAYYYGGPAMPTTGINEVGTFNVGTGYASITTTVGYQGGSVAATIMNPFIVTNKIIKY